MNHIEFQKILREVGEYKTPENHKGALLDRLFGWMDLWYYIRLAGIVLSCSRYAKRGEFTRENWSMLSFRVFQLIENVGGKFEISGAKSLNKLDGGTVYIANHMSMVETFALPAMVLTFNDFLTTVLKESLFKYPVFCRVLKAFDAITVTRKNARDDLKVVLTKGAERLQRGWAVSIFPQSTRSTTVIPEDFNSLGVKLAKKADAAIVPVALKTDFLAPGRIFRDISRLDRSKTIRFSFGEPLSSDGNGKETNDKVIEFISTKLNEWSE